VELSQEVGIDDAEASKELRKGIKQYLTSEEHIDPDITNF
jgi:hypothetical protein